MRIGIMSMQRITNYGSFLQAYGLKQVVEELSGKEGTVEFVDYQPEAPVAHVKESVSKRRCLVARVINMMSSSYRKYRNEQLKIGSTFTEFCNAYQQKFLPTLGVSDKRNYSPKLDLLIIGSDEVFNCTQPESTVGYSRQLFGKDHNARKLISYAASFGSTTLEKLEQYSIKQEVGELLGKFDALSVRDQNSSLIVDELCHRTPEKHIDPVLLYNFPEVDKIEVKLKDYLIVYAYADRIQEHEAVAIRKFAEQKQKKIITLGFWMPWADEYVIASPLEVLAYIKHADYVVTDTFHGTIFSIKYQIPFATIIRKSNQEKLGDLLDTFELQSRQVYNVEDIGKILETDLPETVKKLITDKQCGARSYLLHELSLL
ncbi:polysaccharide pyruvyl transferase family protein [Fusibacillus kribbianus]|uniref:Polysaccharide pyruvyl transferase family protein n=1 Tax=Fusibacillus kribbianus TaxID=3044208 RepID=A0AAP4B969_9FIRM|nr:polysaccharide pyruvyl transferase family protein [Ruminococcus sp. YH-rum2234]MDI9241547.1 polysaccharide pyruvyl transferase family protein [Ruminococcus sp. YH-rum2234]